MRSSIEYKGNRSIGILDRAPSGDLNLLSRLRLTAQLTSAAQAQTLEQCRDETTYEKMPVLGDGARTSQL